MKNIFVYVASRRHKRSHTYYFAEKVIESVEKLTEINYEIFTPSNVNIEYCSGCQYCFKHAHCIKSNKDDMDMIEDKLIKADFIIFASPVYVHNVSADMKNLIDRIGYWGHLLKLAGKGSAVLTTNMSNGHDTAADYLDKVLTSFGSTVVAKYNAATNYPDQLNNPDWLAAVCEIISLSIVDCLENGVESNPALEALFTSLKEMMILYKEHGINEGEWRYWEENNLFDYDSFASVLSRVNGDLVR
ncbi:flavodoxin family protein [Amphibacillus sediminis]|uniref:flavodoxin family protein n=1 Tax=Amphibacillus sediminis TaxID=360185 RepID=UPI000831D421|nr:flavodoxin family protein [Amphibacillus sediminis]